MDESPTTCPDPELLERHAQRALDPADVEHIERHLRACGECSEMFRDMADNLRVAAALKRGTNHGETPAFDFLAEPTTIGPYKVICKIGQGGMGAVYEAEQENPRRTVALKVIRPGAMSISLLSRFRRESQTLGRLQHPGIAQIFEAGTHQTDRGPQPYIVMELVRGAPLLKFAQEHKLDTDARLELLAKICDAVQHAHQRGVIHRDLKPDNILVELDEGSELRSPETGGRNQASTEGTPVAVRPDSSRIQPKILDFGVARVIDPESQNTTLHTSPGQIVGTVAYMSPEQASGNPAEIDTRSDVYALGVIGYQLLCGQLPHKVSPASIAESVRAIVQDDPAPLASIDRTLRGDVTTIVGKALSKEKSRRYASAGEMAEDIRRHLRDEPITAHPPSTLYQLGKFARRNKGLVAGVVAAFVILIAGVIGTGIGLVRAQRALDQATASAAEAKRESEKQVAVNAFLQEILASANPRRATPTDRAKGKDVTLLEAMNEAGKKLDAGSLKNQPEIEVAVRLTIGSAYSELGEFAQAAHHVLIGRDLAEKTYGRVSKDMADYNNSLAFIRRGEGNAVEAEKIAREALELARLVYGNEHQNVAVCISNVALTLSDQGKIAESEPLLRESLAMREKLNGPDAIETASALNNLGLALDHQGKEEEAEALYRKALRIRKAHLGEAHPDIAGTLNNLAFILRSRQKFDEAEQMFREAIAMRRKVLGDEHPSTSLTINNLGSLLQARGKFVEAEACYLEAIALQRKALGDSHPSLASSINNLATLYRDQKKFAEAEPLMRESLAIRRKSLGDKHPAVATALANLASVLRELGRLDEAESLAREGLQIALATRGVDSPEAAGQRSHLGMCLLAMKRYDEAEKELLEAWRVLQPKLATRDPRAISAAGNLRRLYEATGNTEKAGHFAQIAAAATRPAASQPGP